MAEKEYILAVDLGTGGVKTVLFDRDLNMLTRAFQSYETYFPRSGWAEQNPSDWWDALCKTIPKVLAEAKVSPSQIAVVGIDAMTPVMVPMDAKGEVVRPAIIWMDRRADAQCLFIDRELGEDLFRITYNHNDPSNFGPKLMWYRTEEPEAYRRTHIIHHANGYLVYRITGVHSLDKTQCGLSQLCNTGRGDWSDLLIHAYGLDRQKLPDIFKSTDVVGSVSAKAAKELGLIEGIPVIAGSMDNVAAGLGLGVYQNGEMYVSAGTATNVCLCSDKPIVHPCFHVYSHILPDKWISTAGVDFGAAGYKWFKNILSESSYAELDAAVVECLDDLSKPLISIPYMVGQRAPIWNNYTRGVLFGLEPSMGRGQLVRSFMEGNAMGVRRIIKLFHTLGHSTSSARLTGGAAESAVYSQVFADVTGCRMEIIGEKDVAPLGTAMTAAYSVGIYSNFQDMIKNVAVRKSIEPCARRVPYYNDLYEVFVELFTRIEPVYEQLAKIKASYELSPTEQPEARLAS